MSGIFYVLCIGLVIVYLVFNVLGTPVGPRDEAYEKCVLKGVAYYKTIESYPTIPFGKNKGKQAIDVAKKLCKKDTDAFTPDEKE